MPFLLIFLAFGLPAAAGVAVGAAATGTEDKLYGNLGKAVTSGVQNAVSSGALLAFGGLLAWHYLGGKLR